MLELRVLCGMVGYWLGLAWFCFVISSFLAAMVRWCERKGCYDVRRLYQARLSLNLEG